MNYLILFFILLSAPVISVEMTYEKNESAEFINGTDFTYGIWVDSEKWSLASNEFLKCSREPVFNFIANPEVSSRMLHYQVSVSYDELKELLLKSFKRQNSTSYFIVDEERTINGTIVHFWQIDTVYESQPELSTTTLGLLYIDADKVIQVMSSSKKE
ncbi:MAG: hypothetical protein Q8K60_07025, partial [Parachlamydiaceae bacterium]|nr:hypothetical protein [Parachlamydiaceae bacterium]